MAQILKNLLGSNGARERELSDDVRAVLTEMRSECERFEQLLARSESVAERVGALTEPIAQATTGAEAALARLGETERRLEAVESIASSVDDLEAKAQDVVAGQAAAALQLAEVNANSARVREVFEELGAKMDVADGLRDRLEAFLEVEKPFKLLEGEAASIRSQIEATSDQLGRIREQHERLMDAHKTGMSKMEALDRRRDELSRDLTDKERRVVDVEHVVKEMDGIRQTVAEVKRSVGSVKTLSDSIGQKTTALEAQRESVDRALAQAEQLDRAIRQLDAGVRQQQENERSLVALADQVSALQALHQEVLDKNTDIGHLQRAAGDQMAQVREQMSGASEDVRNAVERFDFESKGLESVSQRVADLRGGLTEFEGRFKGLADSSATVKELLAETQGWAPRLESLRNDAARIDDDVKKVHALRRDLDAVARTAEELGNSAARVEEMRPTVEATLADVEKLRGTHAMVHDAIEQSRLAHAEIGRMSNGQAETRTWLLNVENTLVEVRGRFASLEGVTPKLAVVEQQALRITESIETIEARRDGLEDMHRRLAEVTALSADLDHQGRDLSTRMATAEERFLHLSAQAEEAERLSHTIADVRGSVTDSVQKSESIGKSVKSIEARCSSVEALAERTRALGEEIAQRQAALDAAAKDLARATATRQEAADAAEEIGALAGRLDATLASASVRAEELDVVASELETRAGTLNRVDTRLSGFEQRLAKWELVDQQVTRALEQINARQATVRTLQADLDRMVAMAETACEGVRTITSSQREVADSRELLASIQGRLGEVRELAGSLDEKERQMSKAEERLGRAEGFLADVQAGLETLQVQRALVDQAVEKVSSLRFLLKQADAMIEGLRDERKMNSDVQDSLTLIEGGAGRDESDDEDEDVRAA